MGSHRASHKDTEWQQTLVKAGRLFAFPKATLLGGSALPLMVWGTLVRSLSLSGPQKGSSLSCPLSFPFCPREALGWVEMRDKAGEAAGNMLTSEL